MMQTAITRTENSSSREVQGGAITEEPSSAQHDEQQV